MSFQLTVASRLRSSTSPDADPTQADSDADKRPVSAEDLARSKQKRDAVATNAASLWLWHDAGKGTENPATGSGLLD